MLSYTFIKEINEDVQTSIDISLACDHSFILQPAEQGWLANPNCRPETGQHQGQKSQSAPNFDGSDKFALDSVVPANLPIVGSLTNGHFAGGPGAAKVQLFLIGQPIDVDLIGLRLEADLSAQGCANGKLGGAVTVEEFRGKVLPPIADGLNLVIKSDQTAATAEILRANAQATVNSANATLSAIS